MKPIGLTMKKSRNKYRLESGGELMLVHECIECGDLSINRIAADDDPENVIEIFNKSKYPDHPIRTTCEDRGIAMLNEDDMEIVYIRLYGEKISIAI
jgi:hypothetical protein